MQTLVFFLYKIFTFRYLFGMLDTFPVEANIFSGGRYYLTSELYSLMQIADT